MTMYAEERQQAMAQLVAERGRLSVTELAEQYDVTTETVRRDLSALERMGLVRRVHGGAVPATRSPSIESGARRARRRPTPPRRSAIAQAALDLLPPPGSLDPDRRRHDDRRGCASVLPRDHRLTVVTHAVPSRPGWPAARRSSCTCCPGRVRPTTQAAVGADTVAALAELRADLAFLGTNGITVDHGLTTPDRDEAATKRAIVARAPPGRRARRRHQDRRRDTVRFATLDEVDVLVTDGGDRRRRPPGAGRRRSRGRGRMILTLTANPSHRPHGHAGRHAAPRRGPPRRRR